MPVVSADKLWKQTAVSAKNGKAAPAVEAQAIVSTVEPGPVARSRVAAAVNVTVQHIVPPILGLLVFLLIWAQISVVSFFIGFVPGLLATGIGTAISGIGVYKRQTATLMKELET